MTKKLYAFSGLALVLAMSATSLTVLAKDKNNESDNEHSTGASMFAPGQMMKIEARDDNGRVLGGNTTQPTVSINPNGDFKVTGVLVNSVNVAGNSVNVTFYGFTRDINISGATFGGSAQSLADIMAGDVVSAAGNFNSSTHALTVKLVRDVTAHGTSPSAMNDRINQLLEMVRQLQEQLRALKNGH